MSGVIVIRSDDTDGAFEITCNMPDLNTALDALARTAAILSTHRDDVWTPERQYPTEQDVADALADRELPGESTARQGGTEL